MQFYLVAITVVVLYGLSKGGFSGLGSLGIPILSLVTSPVRAAAIVLPILIVQDWVSVWAFRRDYSLRNLIILTPSAAIGVGIGWLLAARVSDDAVRLAIGVISILFVAYMLIRGPPYFLLGQFSRDNLIVSAWLLPVAIISTFAGVKLTYDAVWAIA
jgi:uncharacterized protein